LEEKGKKKGRVHPSSCRKKKGKRGTSFPRLLKGAKIPEAEPCSRGKGGSRKRKKKGGRKFPFFAPLKREKPFCGQRRIPQGKKGGGGRRPIL